MNRPIVLISPPSSGRSAKRSLQPTENVRLGYAAACLRTGERPVVMLDADIERASGEEIEAHLRTLQPAGLVIQLLYRNIAAGLMLAHMAKQLPIQPWVAVFEYAATLSGPPLMDQDSNIDAVILGWPELALLAIAKKPDVPALWTDISGLLLRESSVGAWRATDHRTSSLELDTIPFPARDYLPRSLRSFHVADIISSRGCYGRCTFCNIPTLHAYEAGAAWRARSAQNVVNEIASLVGDYGVTRFNFIDENFIGPRKAGQQRARELARLLRENGLQIQYGIYCRADDITPDLFSELRASGLRLVRFGIESGVPRLLQRYKKGLTLDQMIEALVTLRELAIDAEPSFIMFEPSMSLVELEQNLRFVLTHGLLGLVNPTCVIPFNGTELTAALRNEGCIASSDYLVPGFLPDVTFTDARVGRVRVLWNDWRTRLDYEYEGLSHLLEEMLQIEVFSRAAEDSIFWNAIMADFSELKRVEAEFVLGLIQCLAKKSRLQDETHSLRRAGRVLQRFRMRLGAHRHLLPPHCSLRREPLCEQPGACAPSLSLSMC